MKKLILFASAMSVLAIAPASARVNLDVGIGGPVVVAAPMYAAPPPAYYGYPYPYYYYDHHHHYNWGYWHGRDGHR